MNCVYAASVAENSRPHGIASLIHNEVAAKRDNWRINTKSADKIIE